MKPRFCASSQIFAVLAFTLGPLVGGCAERMPASGLASSYENSDDLTKSATPGGSALVWTRFEDPFEQSFSLEVPKGWTVRGGLFRMGYSDERPMVDLLSPDGFVNVRLGDLAIPTYALPNH